MVCHLQIKDMSNAFPDHDMLDDAMASLIPHLQDHVLLCQMHVEAAMEVRVGEEACFFVPRHDEGMGDGNASVVFVRPFICPKGD